jgi:hypothetical protein
MHFLFGVTAKYDDLYQSINLGLSSSLILMNVSLSLLNWVRSCSTVPLAVVMFWVRSRVRLPTIVIKTGFFDASCNDNSPL